MKPAPVSLSTASLIVNPIRNAATRLAAVEKPCGILASVDTLERYADWGFSFMSAASDLILLRQGIDRIAALSSELDRTKNPS